MKDIKVIDKREIVTMTSLEVVELINNFREEEGNTTKKEHKDFMKSIRKEIEILEKVGITNGGNFSLVSYIDAKGEERPCYKMNKAGIMQMLNKESALVRYKTQQYIEKLEEKIEQDPFENLSPEMKVLLMHDKKIQVVENKVNEVDERFEDLPLIGGEPEELQKTVKKVGTRALGGYGSPAYNDKSLSRKVYSNVWKHIKEQFDVNTYKAIKRKYLSKAKEIAEAYEAPFYLREEINLLNNQGTFK